MVVQHQLPHCHYVYPVWDSLWLQAFSTSSWTLYSDLCTRGWWSHFFSTTIATRIESYTLSSSITHEILNGSRMLRSPIPSWGLGLPQAETIQVNQFTISSPLEAKFQVCRPVSSASMCGINGLQAWLTSYSSSSSSVRCVTPQMQHWLHRSHYNSFPCSRLYKKDFASPLIKPPRRTTTQLLEIFLSYWLKSKPVLKGEVMLLSQAPSLLQIVKVRDS